jgi:hypothetical protein
MITHELLSKELVKYVFKPCMIDSCLFKKTRGENTTYVLVYVDDMLVAGTLADQKHPEALLVPKCPCKAHPVH